jgi:bacterioferritin
MPIMSQRHFAKRRIIMQGNAQLLNLLNQRLSEELTAISQYVVHSEMCDNWGYKGLHDRIMKHAMDEMHHAEALIGRIIFLEGTPVVSKLNPILIGANAKEIILHDYEGELAAVRGYNETMKLAFDVGDNATRDLLAKILQDEEGHVDWQEQQRDQIEQMGIENYLMTQVSG